MTRLATLTCALLLTLTGAPSWAADARVGKFIKYDTGDFVIVTSRGEAHARDIMQNLVKFRVTLEKFLGKRAARSGIGTHILITSHSDWEKYLQPREQIAGWFQRGRFDNYIALDGDGGGFAVPIMFHEYTHYYLSSQFAGEYPPWFNEGLAELMAYARFGKDNKVVLQIPMFRLYDARDKEWIPFERLIKIDHGSPEYQGHKLATEFYAQAWLTVHYGMVEDRDFGRQTVEYLAQLNKLVPQAEAAQAAFGDLEAANTKLRAYSRKPNLPSGAMSLGEIPEITLPRPQPMSEGDGYAAVIDVMLATRLDPNRVRPLIQTLQKREPNAARTWILTARLAQNADDSSGFDAAVKKAGDLLAADDMIGRRELATVLLTSASDFSPTNLRTTEQSQNDLKLALKWFAEAVQKDAGDARALWGLGTVMTRLGTDLDLAETALTVAYRQVPASAEIAVSLANLKAQQQKIEEMIPYLNDTIRIASNLETRRWATETLKRMEEYLAEVRKIDAENRKQREQYEKDLAEYERKYGKAKKKKPAAE